MICKNCGSALAEGAKFCTVCGSKVEFEAPAVEAPVMEAPAEPTYTAPVYTAPIQEPAPVQEPAPAQNKLPEEFEPLSPWAYWGYKLLFSVPIVGFIFLIIFSCKNSNINRRNFARSYWCDLILAAIALVIFIIIAVLGGLGMSRVAVNFNF